MKALTRRKLLKAAAATGAAGLGLSLAGKFAGLAAAQPAQITLKTAKIQAQLADAGPTRDVLTYGDAACRRSSG